MTQQLFKAIDAIVNERIRELPYDKTIVATIADITSANKGKYIVTTDSNITFDAYSENTSYHLNDRVYIRIPENNYSKQKIITGKYISDTNKIKLKDINTSTTDSINLTNDITELKAQIVAQNTIIASLQDEINNLRNNLNALLGEEGE